MVKRLLILSTAFFTATTQAATITLSQKDVAELILKQGALVKEVTFKYEQTSADLIRAQAITDWKLLLETGYEQDRSESLQAFDSNVKYERYRTAATISKSLLTGTKLDLGINRTSQKSDLISPTTPSQLTADQFTLGLEQSLLGNTFGQGDRATVRLAESTYQANIVLRANELEDAVLNALGAYWNAYVAQENFRDALASRDRYEKLVSAVRRKTSLGYANPGELSQVQAEYEARVQTVKSSSLTYLTQLDSLLTQLGLPTGTEITFSVPKELPPVPKLGEKAIEELRTVRSQALKLRASEDALIVAESARRPNLNLVGRYASAGVEDTSEASYSELTSGSNPTYYVGLKLAYNFGSGTLAEDVRARRAARSLEEVRLQRTRDEERDRSVASERKVGSTFAIAQSAIKQREYRQKAVDELNRTYSQGRTDISVLIEALNRLFTTEVASIRALGDYQIALNEWAANRDELIPDDTKKENP